LAERAGVSARNIQNLERGENRPLRDTARRLAAALGLGERDRAWLLTAAVPVPRRRGPGAPGPLAPVEMAGQGASVDVATRHNLPAALSSFIGRAQERARVSELLASQ